MHGFRRRARHRAWALRHAVELLAPEQGCRLVAQDRVLNKAMLALLGLQNSAVLARNPKNVAFTTIAGVARCNE